jgi:hypothetical protein
MTENFTTKDSGQRRTFDTGARRDQAAGKGRFDLLNWDMIERDAQLLERGALKYDDNNWKKGIPLKSFQDSAARHLSQLIRGDRSEDHAAAVRWNISGYEWTRREILAGRLPAALADGTAVAPEIATLVAVVRVSEESRFVDGGARGEIKEGWAGGGKPDRPMARRCFPNPDPQPDDFDTGPF